MAPDPALAGPGTRTSMASMPFDSPLGSPGPSQRPESALEASCHDARLTTTNASMSRRPCRRDDYVRALGEAEEAGSTRAAKALERLRRSRGDADP